MTDRENWLATQFREWAERADRLRAEGFRVTGSMRSTYTKDATDPMVSVTVCELHIDSRTWTADDREVTP